MTNDITLNLPLEMVFVYVLGASEVLADFLDALLSFEKPS